MKSKNPVTELAKNPVTDFLWNEVSKANPPIGEPLIVTIRDNLQGMPNQLRYPVYYVKDTMKHTYCWKWLYGDMAYDLLPEVSEVIAWQHMPGIFDGTQECTNLEDKMIRLTQIQSVLENELYENKEEERELIEERNRLEKQIQAMS